MVVLDVSKAFSLSESVVRSDNKAFLDDEALIAKQSIGDTSSKEQVSHATDVVNVSKNLNSFLDKKKKNQQREKTLDPMDDKSRIEDQKKRSFVVKNQLKEEDNEGITHEKKDMFEIFLPTAAQVKRFDMDASGFLEKPELKQFVRQESMKPDPLLGVF